MSEAVIQTDEFSEKSNCRIKHLKTWISGDSNALSGLLMSSIHFKW